MALEGRSEGDGGDMRYKVGQWVWMSSTKMVRGGAACGTSASYEPDVEKMFVRYIGESHDDYRVVELSWTEESTSGYYGVRYEDVFPDRVGAQRHAEEMARKQSEEQVRECEEYFTGSGRRCGATRMRCVDLRRAKEEALVAEVGTRMAKALGMEPVDGKPGMYWACKGHQSRTAAGVYETVCRLADHGKAEIGRAGRAA